MLKVELLDNNNNSLAKSHKILMENINLTTQTMAIIKLSLQFQKIMQLRIKDAGGDDTKDSDPDSDGTVNVTIKDDDNFTIDMGIYTPKASIGDFVWDDINRNGIQDENESGVANVEVILLDGDGNEVNRTQTDENGKYLFTDLKIGDYQVEFNLSTIPENYDSAQPKMLEMMMLWILMPTKPTEKPKLQLWKMERVI